ncbi:unnamed protein product [Parnassius apollo]|uniref:(apollo) hypothetical protein n=1 Tax=Parnassius apollo TaxID=110799 RepID=A0A8S3Y2Z4_PARAO|nr:unnamed protein product [Parnassius apollo]
MNGRARRILSLVPARNAGSDVSDGSSSDDEVRDVESSPAPSLDSSFEKLDILGSPTSSPNHPKQEVESRAEDLSDVDSETFQVSLTPILNAVFPSPTQCNYDAIPLISSVSSITSVEPSTPIADVTPLVTRGQRKRTGPSVSVNKVKKAVYQKTKLTFPLEESVISTQSWLMGILLDICINNAWLLRRRHDNQINKKRKQDRLKDFRYEIYAGLLKRNRIVPVKDVLSVPEKSKIKKPMAERPLDDVREMKKGKAKLSNSRPRSSAVRIEDNTRPGSAVPR